MKKFLISAAVLVFFSSVAPCARAQPASQQSEVAGATTGLGSSHRFKTLEEATAHCPDDTVVWSSGPDKKYALPGFDTYGKGGGFFACKMEADDAGFQPMQP